MTAAHRRVAVAVPRLESILRERVIVRHAPIQLRALRIGKRKAFSVGADGHPYFLDECKPLIDVESIMPKVLTETPMANSIRKISLALYALHAV